MVGRVKRKGRGGGIGMGVWSLLESGKKGEIGKNCEKSRLLRKIGVINMNIYWICLYF